MPQIVLAPSLARWLTAAPTPTSSGQTFSVEGITLRDCLDDFFHRYPQLRGYVCDELGTVRHHVVIFLDGQALEDKADLNQTVTGATTISLYQALSGG